MHHIVALLSQAFYSVLDASLVEALQIQLSLQKHPGVETSLSGYLQCNVLPGGPELYGIPPG